MSQMTTDDSMSDDVFEDDSLRAPAQRSTPSPTGYRDYQAPAETPARTHVDDDVPIHKTILLGDSGVGKTSLLVQFETGKFQAGNFSATVGIGFTVSTLISKKFYTNNRFRRLSLISYSYYFIY
ncbi:ras-related protein Rab-26-like isoform X3 [Galleria mellonella]|uniref:Ras-related protein Rab-26-like isoform X3 n=1 Tax=Galleria mellonella TaxID=7137 RepID=A0ABM3MGW5_GALME|nr:ras-related protein Rab-26-like isoform X3 [Galleria mellonella]